MTKEEVYAFLDSEGIRYEVTEHKAVFNMAEVAEIPLPHPEADAKNLFVRDSKRQQYFLITVKGDKRVDLKAFRKANGIRQLEFATAEELLDLLKLTPGSVTPFGLLNDEERKIEYCLDRYFENGLIGCHPNDNTATVWLDSGDLIRLVREHGNRVRILDL